MTEARRVLYVGEGAAASSLADAGSFRVEGAPPTAAPERVPASEHDAVVLGPALPEESLLESVAAVGAPNAGPPVFVFSTAPVAEAALERGAAGYVRAAGPERWTVLANRVRSALEHEGAERRELKPKLETYEAIVDAAPDGVYTLDEAGRFDIVNRAAAELVGLDRADLVGEPLETLAELGVATADAVEEARQRFAALNEGDRVRFEDTVAGPDGERIVENNVASLSGGAIVNVVRDVTERERRERELETYEAVVDAASDGIYTLDEAGRFDIVNRAFATAAGVPPESLVGEPVESLVEHDVVDPAVVEEGHRHIDDLRAGERTRFESAIRTVRGERTVENNLTKLPDGGVVNVLRDVTQRNEDRRAVARQRDELETLNRINGVVRSVIAGLVDETSREGIERTVCRGLVESGLYRCAWVGETTDGDAVRIQTAMGEWAPMDGPPESPVTGGPALTAVETGTVQAVDDFSEVPCRADEPTPSGVAVPLSHGAPVDGVLTVCADRTDAFSPRERDAFGVLGEVVGFALTAVHHQELLLADSVTELRFDAPDSGSAFVRASREHRCRIERRGFVPKAEGGLHYAAVDGADPGAVLGTLLGANGFEDGRVVSTDGESGVLELHHTGASIALLLTDRGARVREAVSEAGETRIVADVPPGVDVRGIVDAVQAEFPAVELLGKRRRERSATASSTVAAAEDRLTDRQRSALSAAYFAGYYNWPRDSTAEELAASMGISSATLHQHLRTAQRKLFDSLFGLDT